MADFRKSFLAEVLEAFFRGVESGQKKRQEAEKKAADEANTRDAQKPTLKIAPFNLNAFNRDTPDGHNKSEPSFPSFVEHLNAAAKAREAEEEKARKAEQDGLHFRLLATDPKYRARHEALQSQARAAEQRLYAKQKADLRKMRELSEYGRGPRPTGERKECYTCNGRGRYFSNRLNREVDCIDCSGKGWQKSRY
jgi:hypothetical protein